MLLKWIVCTVSDECKNSFSEKQQKWKEISSISGFLGQVGGWDLKAPDDACIVCLWQDQFSYKEFMEKEHDRIFLDNNQAAVFEKIEVTLLEPTSIMPGVHKNMLDCLHLAKAIRVADCFVIPEREEHFNQAEKQIWIPGMAQAQGMLAGSYNKALGKDVRYIVTTLWASLEEHNQYAQTLMPEMQKKSEVSHDIKRMLGRVIVLDDNWLVAPATATR